MKIVGATGLSGLWAFSMKIVGVTGLVGIDETNFLFRNKFQLKFFI